jgi:hypothetical protein
MASHFLANSYVKILHIKKISSQHFPQNKRGALPSKNHSKIEKAGESSPARRFSQVSNKKPDNPPNQSTF